MPEKKSQHWTESLFDSVYALYETAREYQLAHRAAQAAVETVNIDRRKAHEGRITLVDETTVYGKFRSHEPHADALFGLSRLYGDLESVTGRRYEEAALLYASGAAWAIREVLTGETPTRVGFVTEDRLPVPRSMQIPGLLTYSEGPALDAAYDAVRRCMDVSEYGEDLAGRDYVTDHEAGEMFRAGDVAGGLADAAYAYGLLAQRAVNFALLEPRRLWHSELAAARAAEQTAQPSN
ncbi:hypothetical protein OG244_19565 [Streptomyces brevispora]|uniref:hypothetical protein n=1 Tax=Streptomyces brevispora TaxID=887462 RepID=UPI002E3541BF|nr:hypothetical protein [Streptomyces brevispora]